MAGQKTISSTYVQPIPPPGPVADYHIEQNPELNPDCSGDYFDFGIHEMGQVYRRQDGMFFIFPTIEGFWAIMNSITGEETQEWYAAQPAIIGTYNLLSPNAEGIATVAAGPA